LTASPTSMLNGPSPYAHQVLLVEDSPGDVRLTREAFKDANASLTLHVACDGIDGLAFLRHEEPHVESPRPDLIVLDLNLPRMDGRELLAIIKADDELKAIPTIILTASNAETDIDRCHELKANCYLCKPQQLDEFWDLVQSINTFWLGYAKLPQMDQRR
jgi:two-component system, chemotaxis family, response regulator Rcp1